MGKYSQWLGTSDLPFLLPKWLLWKCGLPVALLWKLNGQANGLSKGNGQIADLWGLVDLCWLPPRRFETVQGKKWYQNSLFYAIPLAATVVERRSHTKTCNSSTHIGYRADFFWRSHFPVAAAAITDVVLRVCWWSGFVWVMVKELTKVCKDLERDLEREIKLKLREFKVSWGREFSKKFG